MLVPGFNDLGTRRPEIAAEWSPRNEKPASAYPPASKHRAWWVCAECGNEWDAVIKNRTVRNTGCPRCRGRKRGKGVMPQWLIDEWHPDNEHPATFYAPGSGEKVKWVCAKGHTWKAVIQDRFHKQTQCRRCVLNGTSGAEQELYEFVVGVCPDAKLHDRSVAVGYEYDISVPSKKIAIEYNGLYWHTEEYKSRHYHQDKTDAANENGWQVVHVWEDDNPEIVRRMLAHKLEVSTEPRYSARDLEIREVARGRAKDFLNRNHIQGFTGSSVRLGLYDGADLKAVMLFLGHELVRFATDGVVRGGFSKLLKHYRQMYPDAIITTFSDNGVSDGGLYKSNGFEITATLPPDYWYFVGGKRVHKFNYRKKRFRDDPDLLFESGLTERELAQLNGLKRIYGLGKVRWDML